MHAIALHAPAGATSVLDLPRFWEKYAYQVGPHTFSLDDMEHGVLRGVCARSSFRAWQQPG